MTSQRFHFRFSMNPDKPNWFCVCSSNSLRVHQPPPPNWTSWECYPATNHTQSDEIYISNHDTSNKKKITAARILFSNVCVQAGRQRKQVSNAESFFPTTILEKKIMKTNQPNKTPVLNKAKVTVKEMLFRNQKGKKIYLEELCCKRDVFVSRIFRVRSYLSVFLR